MSVSRFMGVPLVLALATSAALAADERVERLPEAYREWLEEEVVYIITKREKNVFLDLTTIQERDRFIESFWDRRDTDPATLENEFKVEHYRRLDYANTVLARDAPRAGWRTDRGEYYIILGKPLEIQRYDGEADVVAIEIWFYMGDAKYGLPGRFNLMFFKENDIGEYTLYHPLGDGPERLLRGGYANQLFQVNQNIAMDILEGLSIDLARASLTIDLTETTTQFLSYRNSRDPIELNVRPAMNVNRTLADIIESPMRRVDTEYLDGYLEFGDRVSADYSFKYFAVEHSVAVLYGPNRTPFVHYALEIAPEKFTLESDRDETRYYTTLDVDLQIRDAEGRLMATDLNQPLLQLSASDFQKANGSPFGYRDNYPVLPGDYKVSVVLKNRATKEYTAFEREIHVPAVEPGKPFLGEIVLGYGKGIASTRPGGHLTYQLGATEVYPVTEEASFQVSANVEVLVQALEVPPDYSLRYSILGPEGTVSEEEQPVGDSGDAAAKTMSLLGLDAGNYEVQVELADQGGSVVATRKAPFVVSPRTVVPRPAFVYRHSFNAGVPGFLDFTLGNQLMAAGRTAEAEAALERAVAFDNPDLPMARWRLASMVLFSRDADRALELLLPLVDAHPNEYEVVEGIGFAWYIKQDYAQAKDYLERSAGIRAPDTSLLNAVGDCYERLGDNAKAREYYERSLELNPQQGGVKVRLEGLDSAGSGSP